MEQSYINQIILSPGITVMAKIKMVKCNTCWGSQTNIQNLGVYPFVNQIILLIILLILMGELSKLVIK